jgi:hypothetical protein
MKAAHHARQQYPTDRPVAKRARMGPMMQDAYTAPDAITRLADRLRAAQAAALADPNTPPGRRKLLELRAAAKPRPWWDTENPRPPTPARTRKRKPSLASVIRQMKKAGVEIAGVEVNPRDGSIMVRSGKPTDATTVEPPPLANEWDDVLIR